MPALLQRTSRSFAVSGAFAGRRNRRRPWPRVDLCAALLALLGATASLGCATASEPPSTAKEAAVMTAPESAFTAANPTLSAEEIGERFLKLVGRLESRSDLDLDLVRTTLGLRFSRVPGDEHHLVSEAPLGSGWSYIAGFLEATPSNLSSVYLDFRSSQGPDAELTPVCTLDFGHYHNAMIEMGFMADPYYDYDHGRERLLDWRYTKFREGDGSVDMTISIVPQDPPPGATDRRCVKSISMLN